MKKIFLIGAYLFLMTACATESQIDKINNFIDDTETECTTFTEEDWEQNVQEFESLIKDYQNNYDSYTEEERREVGKAVGRYAKLKLRQGYEQLKELGKELAPLVDGFMSGLTEDE